MPVSSTITSGTPHHARVVRTLSSSDWTRAVTASSPRRSARGKPPRASRARPSARAARCRSPPRARRFAPARGPRRVSCPRARSTFAPCAASSERSRDASGLRTRVPPCAPASTSAIDRLLDELAAVDDHDAVDGLRDLGEHVARDEDRPAFGGERAQEVAQPAHARRDRGRWRARRARAPRGRRAARSRARAAGACRASSPSRAASRRRSARRARAPPRRASAEARRRRRAHGGGCGRIARMDLARLEHRADLVQRPRRARGRRWPSDGRARRRPDATSPSTERSVVDLPAPFGPRKPVIVPGSTRKRQPVDGEHLPVPLGQIDDFDHQRSVET